MARRYRQSTLILSGLPQVESDNDIQIEEIEQESINKDGMLGIAAKGKPNARIRIDRSCTLIETSNKPSWVAQMLPYFTCIRFGGRDKRNKQAVDLRCKAYVKSNAKKNIFTSRDLANITKHLMTRYKDTYQNYLSQFKQIQTDVSELDEESASAPTISNHPLVSTQFFLNPASIDTEEGRVERYPSDYPRQVEFNEVLTQAIVLDSMPFQIVDRPGFKTLIQFLDKQLSIPVRNTLVARIEIKYVQVGLNGQDRFVLTNTKNTVSLLFNLTAKEHYQQFTPVNNPGCLVVD